MNRKSKVYSSFESLSPDEFESLVASVWSAMGWTTNVTSTSHDRGIDIIATKSGVVSEKVVIQAKCYKKGNRVGSPEIQQYNTLKQQVSDSDAVIVVTSSSFTSEALSLKDSLDIKLVNGRELVEAIIEHLSDTEISRRFELTEESSPNSTSTSKRTISLQDMTYPEKVLEQKYEGYINRLMNDIQKGKPNRILYFHLDGGYTEDQIYNPDMGIAQERKYVVNKGVHRIKFQSDSPDLYLKFQKTCQNYGWEIISCEAIGTTEIGVRGLVQPENANTFFVSVNTEKSDSLLPMRQAKISNLILENVFGEDIDGMRVSDGVSGLNVNRHSRIIE